MDALLLTLWLLAMVLPQCLLLAALFARHMAPLSRPLLSRPFCKLAQLTLQLLTTAFRHAMEWAQGALVGGDFLALDTFRVPSLAKFRVFWPPPPVLMGSPLNRLHGRSARLLLRLTCVTLRLLCMVHPLRLLDLLRLRGAALISSVLASLPTEG